MLPSELQATNADVPGFQERFDAFMPSCLHAFMPSWPSSRPKPLSFHALKGAPNSDTSSTLIPTPPASSRSAVYRAVVRSRV